MSDGVDNLKQSAYNKAEELKHSTEESKTVPRAATLTRLNVSVVFWCARAVSVLMFCVQRSGAERGEQGELQERRMQLAVRHSGASKVSPQRENKPNECAIGGETRTREQQQR
jgi:hypothetical protein